MKRVDVLQKEVPYSFDEAMKRVEAVMEEERFGVMLVKDVSKIFDEKLGTKDYPKHAFVLGCKAPLAKMALDVSSDVLTLMPCSFVVYEKDDKVFVAHSSIMKIASAIGLADEVAMEPVIEETGKHVKRVWDKI